MSYNSISMKSYKSFIFESINFRPHSGKIVLRYSLDKELSFEETIMLPDDTLVPDIAKRDDIQAALFALHLIGGISYYKTFCPGKIEIKNGGLSKSEAQFWNTVYLNGLGQFFYENKLDFRNRINFPSSPTPTQTQTPRQSNQKRILVPIGGGKDSLVTIELLKKSGADITLLRVGPHPFIEQLAHDAGLPLLEIRRSLSPALFKLNEKGALNGHVPITAYISILSILVALLYDFDAVVMSDEASSDEGNIKFHGMDINHQWSKSLEFENMFRKYIKTSIGSNIEYFSLLRPFSELKIANLFSGFPKYFGEFTSCNINWKILASPSLPRNGGGAEGGGNRWCCACPKCASVFACLAAFLPREKLEMIFGAIPFENEALMNLYRELLGVSGHKPFECVGTADETKAAFLLAMRRGDLSGTPIMKMFIDEVLPAIKDQEKLIAEVLAIRPEHCIPDLFQKLIVL